MDNTLFIDLVGAIPLLILASTFEFVIMSITWFYAQSKKNAAYVDVAWAKSFTGVTLIYALFNNGLAARKFTLLLMVACWSYRLAIHIWNRVRRETHEDKRYAEMRRQFGDNADRKFFLLFQFQALVVILLSAPFQLSCTDIYPTFRTNEYIGIVMFICSFIGEIISDQQLKKFKADDKNKGEVCDVGLWKYSRHPNYFFEWMVWCSFFVFIVGSPHGAIAVISPLLMLLFLTKVSGIPPAEKQSLESKGEKYREYQRKTSVFVPWFPKAK